MPEPDRSPSAGVPKGPCVLRSSRHALSVITTLATAGLLIAAPAAANAATTFRARAVQVAASHRGDPYVYGAIGPHRFDCSGFTLYVFRQVGKSLTHNAAGQYRQTQHIAKTNKRPGDLIFYTSNGSASGITHVAIYAGNGYTWVAPHSGSHVERQKIYTSHYLVGRVR